MTVKPHPKKIGFHIIDCRPGGYKAKRLRIVYKGTREAAEDTERSLMGKANVIYQPKQNKTIENIFERWMVFYRNNRIRMTVKDAQGAWLTLCPHFGKYCPHELTQSVVEEYKASRVKSVKPITANKDLRYLTSMLNWGANNQLCQPLTFKIKGFDKKLATSPKPRPITQNQVTAIYEAIDQEYKLVFLLMADAGLRRNEALHLKAGDIELDQGVLYIWGKGSKEPLVPILTDRLKKEIDLKLAELDQDLTKHPPT